MYGAPWCGDCHRSRRLLDQRGIRYDWIDVDQDEQALAYIQRLQDGGRRIPTIVFGDGTWLAEPTNPQLEAKLASLGSTDGRNGVRSAG
jgi:glutaredoxin-like protein